ncbi:MAG TPA: hypothetical protein VLW52_03925 [Opitutaceae bacterium]|nr:hypothetical protein [Opitutaceae bacterium]
MPGRHSAVVAPQAARLSADRPGWRIVVVAGALLLGSASASAAGFLDWLGVHHDVQVITATDLTPAGMLLRPASPEHPVYYVAVSRGYHDFGDAIAGDKLPDPHEMIRTIARVLAKQGYLPADDRHPATQCVILSWGTLYPIKVPYASDSTQPPTQLNRFSMLQFLGGNQIGLVPEHPDPSFDAVLLPGLTGFNPNAEAIASVAGEDLYVVALAGYEFPEAQPKHPKLLWRTKISCPARGLVLADSLPTMVTIAGPYIGRSTAAPVWVNASDRFKPDVRIGNPKVEEYIDSPSVPIFESGHAATKPKREGKP